MIINTNPKNINHAIQALSEIIVSEFSDLNITTNQNNQITNIGGSSNILASTTNPNLNSISLNSTYCGTNFDISRYIPLWVVYEKTQRIAEGEPEPISIFDFLQKYYNWLYCDLDGGGQYNLSYQLLDLIDIEKTKTEYYKKFLNTFVDGAPETILDKITGTSFENFIKDIRKNLYIRKTTKEAIIYFFKTLFEINENEIKLYFPKENMLRLNGGKFYSDDFNFTYKKLNETRNVNTAYASPGDEPDVFDLFLISPWERENLSLIFSPTTSETLIVGSSTQRTLYFKSASSAGVPTRKRIYTKIMDSEAIFLRQNSYYKASIKIKKLKTTQAPESLNPNASNWIFFRVGLQEKFNRGVLFDVKNGEVGNSYPGYRGTITKLTEETDVTNPWFECTIYFKSDFDLNKAETENIKHFMSVVLSSGNSVIDIDSTQDPFNIFVMEQFNNDVAFSAYDGKIEFDFQDVGSYSTINHLGGSALNIGRLQDSDWIQDYSYLLKVGITAENYIETYKNMLHPAGLRVVFEKEITDYEGPGEGEDTNLICEFPILKNYTAYRLGTNYTTAVGTFGGVTLYGLTCCNGFSGGFTAGFTGPSFYFPNWNGNITETRFDDINISDFFSMCFISGFTSPNEGITCDAAPCDAS